MKQTLYNYPFDIGMKVPVKLWLDDIESGALDQAIHLSQLPFIFKHVAIMPDSHQGYGMPIGGVIALDNVVIPNAVGVDIGCGMRAVKTCLKADEVSQETLKSIVYEIKKVVPVGKNHQTEKQDEQLIPDNFFPYCPIVHEQWESIQYQLGTLGGGNHFIEIQKDENGYIWIMLHSGSRNIGKRVADHYNKIAIELNKKWHSAVDPSYQLAFLPLNSDEGQAYMNEMNWCVKFAEANRALMMKRIKEVLLNHHYPVTFDRATPYVVLQWVYTWNENEIDIAHNYAALENHFGKNVMVHRKGATRVRLDEIGIIPGSQGTNSYIVKGLGNPQSFMSCSHGAGRAMSRTAAKDVLSLEEQQKILNEQNIIHDMNTIGSLDEAPGAYKDIDVVMENQKDLVEIVTKLTPLAVIKGD
jgi:tRNA-splicing ligase RtcB